MSLTRLLSIAFLTFASGFASADDAESVIKYRQAVMKVIGGHMQALSTIVRGNVYGGDLALHARGMAETAALTGTLFPAGSGTGKTKALARIWEQPEAFGKKVEAFESAAARLAAVAKAGDAAGVAGAMRDLGGSCKGCHDDYRAE